MKTPRRLALVLAVAGFIGACTADEIGPEFVEVSEADSGLMFYGPGLAGGYRQFLTGQDSHYVRRTVATYGPRTGEYPFARMYLAETPPNRHFTRAPSIKQTIEQWGWFQNKTISIGPTGDTTNAIGRIDYAAVSADGISCVIWLQLFGPREGTGVGTRLLNGYYCRGAGPMMSASEAESIVRLVGHRWYGAFAPPEGLSTEAHPPIPATGHPAAPVSRAFRAASPPSPPPSSSRR